MLGLARNTKPKFTTATQRKIAKAKRFAEISHLDVLQKRLQVMDSTAFSLCMGNKMPIIVFDFFKPHNLRRAVLGEKAGALVS
jgi:uridylate kinase